MKKYQKKQCMKKLSKQVEASLERKKETIPKGVHYYQAVEEANQED